MRIIFAGGGTAGHLTPILSIVSELKEIAKEYKGKLKVCKVNVDEAPNTASKYGVMSIPLVLFFKNGEEVERMTGLRSQSSYEDVLDRLIEPTEQTR